jgi:hypothetical protein
VPLALTDRPDPELLDRHTRAVFRAWASFLSSAGEREELRVRIREVHITDFKGLDVRLDWAPAVVLFGANDSGKTNALEGFVYGLAGGAPVRRAPHLTDRRGQLLYEQPRVALLVELDGLGLDGHADQEIFLTWLLARSVAVSWLASESDEQDVVWPNDDEVRSELRAEFAGLDWTSPPEEEVTGDLVSRLLAATREALSPHLAAATEAERGGLPSAEKVVASRLFRVTHGGVSWLWQSPDGVLVPFARFDLRAPMESPHAISSMFDALGLRVVPVTSALRSYAALHQSLEHLILAMAKDWRIEENLGGAPWMGNDRWVQRVDGVVTLRPGIEESCSEVAEEANRLAASLHFVSSAYSIEVVPLFPDQWEACDGHRVALRLRARETDREFDIALAASGLAGWTFVALAEAIRRGVAEYGSPDHYDDDVIEPPDHGHTIYVFDEPEAHLHPLAQEQAAAWVAELAQGETGVLLATHAVPFLHLSNSDAQYFKVARTADWATRVEQITDDILGAVRDFAEALGLPPVALIQLTRAWLVVEGEHDRKVLELYHSRALRQARIQILPLSGAERAEYSFLNLEALGNLGIPFFCLLDNVLAPLVGEGAVSDRPRTREERIADKLRRVRDAKGVDLTVYGLKDPDIICALPIEAVRRVAAAHDPTFRPIPSWPAFISAHEQQTKQQRRIKTYVKNKLGLTNLSDDDFMDELLKAAEDCAPDDNELGRIVESIVARIGGSLEVPASWSGDE